MKNIKNTIAAGMMMAVMLFGTTFANAGIIILRSAETPAEPCSTTKGAVDVIKDMLGGIIILRTGIIILRSGAETCTTDADKGGIIIL